MQPAFSFRHNLFESEARHRTHPSTTDVDRRATGSGHPSGGAGSFIRLRRGRSPYEVLASSRGRNQTSAEAEAAGLPAYSCACRLGRPLSKRAARRYLELLNGGDPSGSDKQIQVDLLVVEKEMPRRTAPTISHGRGRPGRRGPQACYLLAHQLQASHRRIEECFVNASNWYIIRYPDPRRAIIHRI